MTVFPFSMTTPARFTPALPPSTEVVVIGGGVMGVMTAHFLARAGVRVVLCEKGRIAAEQSSRNWGWIRQQGRDLAELPIMMESLSIWQDLSQRVGPDLGFRQEGVLYLARTEAEMAGFQDWRDQARGLGLCCDLKTGVEVSAMIPDHRAPWQGGLFTASDARAEPRFAVPLLAGLAVDGGAVLIEDCAVRALDRAGGRIVGVLTEKGRIACDQVVLAGGAWSSLLLAREGVALPQLSVLASVAATAPLPQVFAGNAADDRFAFRRRADGGYTLAPGSAHDFHIGPSAFRHFAAYLPTLRKDWRSTRFRAAAPAGFPDAWGTPRHWSADDRSPFEDQRILSPRPNLRALAAAAAEFGRAFPRIGAPPLVQTWGGMIDTLPDLVPVIDRIAAVPGLVVATGLSGHGFGIGPGLGRVVADLVLGNPLGHDLSRFRFGRFSDGTGVRPGPTL